VFGVECLMRRRIIPGRRKVTGLRISASRQVDGAHVRKKGHPLPLLAKRLRLGHIFGTLKKVVSETLTTARNQRGKGPQATVSVSLTAPNAF